MNYFSKDNEVLHVPRGTVNKIAQEMKFGRVLVARALLGNVHTLNGEKIRNYARRNYGATAEKPNDG